MNFSQIVFLFLNPLFWVLFLLLTGLILWKRKAGIRILVVSFILFYLFSNRFIVDELVRRWESELIRDTSAIYPFDAAIVLGGNVVNYDKRAGRLIFRENADKILQAITLYKSGKVSTLVLSGGPSGKSYRDKYEAALMRKYLVEIGIPDTVILVDSVSDNTHENAVNSALMLKERVPGGRFLLVTTALHMRRAERCFKKQDLDVIPYPVCKITGPPRKDAEILLVPHVDSFLRWRDLIHEAVGYWIYRIRGFC
jgi:uncharacterized SAM-binding protein YcdF (DUF218 family)